MLKPSRKSSNNTHEDPWWICLQSDNARGHATLKLGHVPPFPVQNVYPSQYALCIDVEQDYQQDI